MIDLTDDIDIGPDDIYMVDSDSEFAIETIDDGNIVMDEDVGLIKIINEEDAIISY